MKTTYLLIGILMKNEHKVQQSFVPMQTFIINSPNELNFYGKKNSKFQLNICF
jgi:hypothetical protein